jgi:hypothetical protein
VLSSVFQWQLSVPRQVSAPNSATWPYAKTLAFINNSIIKLLYSIKNKLKIVFTFLLFLSSLQIYSQFDVGIYVSGPRIPLFNNKNYKYLA